MWQQTRQPNLDPYIIQPNGKGGVYTLTDWFGWCLAYVQTSLGTGWGGNTAWDCWENQTINRHEDRNLPGGVFVPIFFSGYHGMGHTAIYKDGEVWSSPVSHKPYADTWGSIAEVERAYGVTYVGWSEGIGGTPVVQYVDDTPVEPAPEPVVVPVVVPEPTPAPEPPPPPAPYVPPAAPLKGTLATKYTVLTTIMQFGAAQDAIFHKNPTTIVKPGDYFQFATQDSAVQLGKDNMNAQFWINTRDNVAPIPDVAPEVDAALNPVITENWKSTFSSFPDGKSRRYVAQRDMFLYDLAAAKAEGLNIKHGDSVPIYGSVQKGGLTYLVPRLQADTVEGQIAPKEHWFGIPTTSVYTGLPNMKSQQYIDALTKAEEENRVYRKSVHHETTEDKVYYAEQLIARAVKDGVRFLNQVIPLQKIKAMYSQKEKK